MEKMDFRFLKRRIKGKKNLSKLNDIKENYKSIFKECKIIKSKQLFNIKIGKYKIWLKEGTSSSSLMTYLEIFKEKVHMKKAGFSGKGNKVVIDVGGNEGYYVLKMKENNPNLKIITLEPVPSTFKLLKKNIESNKLKNVILINKALTKKKGKLIFEIIPEVSAVCATNIKMQKRPWLDTKRIKKIIVKSTTLIDLCKKLKIDKIDILKLDVEGSELEILKNSKPILNNIKKIVIEWHSEKLKRDCIKFLKKNGFKLVYQEKKICGDLYFINSN